MLLASYTFNSQYRPSGEQHNHLPSLRLLEGGRFLPKEFSPVLIEEYGQIRLRFFKWGFIPAWARGIDAKKHKTFADVNHIFDHIPYQLAIHERRCLIPADGFYVEQDTPRGKQAFKLSNDSGENFCFAGIYDTRKGQDGGIQHSFAILTTATPPHLQSLGLRMPLILPRHAEQSWLNPHTPLKKIMQLFHAVDAASLHLMPVIELQETHAPLSDPLAA